MKFFRNRSSDSYSTTPEHQSLDCITCAKIEVTASTTESDHFEESVDDQQEMAAAGHPIPLKILKVAPTPKTPEGHPKDESQASLYFRDGVRRIDFILAYQRNTEYGKSDSADKMRKVFEDHLLEEGLDLELDEQSSKRDSRMYYLKIHSPWEVLTRYAELLHLKMPIRKQEKIRNFPIITVPEGEKPTLPDVKELQKALSRTPKRSPKASLERLWGKLVNPFPYNRKLIPDEGHYFNTDFQRDKERFFIMSSRETFFSQAQRSRITWEVLMRASFDAQDRQKGIYRLLNDGVYLAAYPLHDGPCGSGAFDPVTEVRTERRILYSEWARPAAWYRQQPLHLVRRYFGEKTGLYFAWLGFYTSMLFLPAFIGVMTTFYGISEMTSNTPTKETCDPHISGNIILCPGCKKRCSYDYLSSKCTFSKIVYLFDNPATVGFSIFVALWATIFIELWKRKQAVLGWEWNLTDVDAISEIVNPEYEAKATVYKLNPVTMQYEPYVPLWEKIARISGANSVVLFMMCLVICTVFGIIAYRIILLALLSRNQNWRALAHVTTAITASLLNLVIILAMNRVYCRIATRLTDVERPRTQSEYEDSFTFKMFLFTFLNTYSSLIYIAFFKGRFNGHPGKPGTLFGYSLDTCEGGCLYEVCVQLAIVMVGKQVISNVQEIGQPLVMNWWRKSRRQGQGNKNTALARWELDYDLEQWTTLSLFYEYLEMAIQFGFVTLFVAAFPLAPLFALLNNIVEIRLDAYKYTSQLRRPLAQRVSNIGAWQVILKGVSIFAVICNAFLIAYTSDFIPRLLYRLVHTKDNSLRGFVNFTLSTFDTADYDDENRPENATLDGIIVKQCRYIDYREPPGAPNQYELSLTYWHIFAARLFFVVVFEHVVFSVTGLVAAVIPDVPRSVQQRIKREQVVTHEVFVEAEKLRKASSRSSTADHTTINEDVPQ
ncbi:anoctamin-5-like isoform X1 [Ornithodoros turicata]|uniref:anoctamin-5-like isoform X1 n=2 Tax=Ornithodoros turicata TaxID=34597 RepID=UPI0031392727